MHSNLHTGVLLMSYVVHRAASGKSLDLNTNSGQAEGLFGEVGHIKMHALQA